MKGFYHGFSCIEIFHSVFTGVQKAKTNHAKLSDERQLDVSLLKNMTQNKNKEMKRKEQKKKRKMKNNYQNEKIRLFEYKTLSKY